MTKTKQQEDTITINGTAVPLKYTLYSLVQMENKGVKLMDLDEHEITMEQLAVLVWAGVLHELPTIPLEEVQQSIDVGKIPEVAEAVKIAINKK